MKLVKIIHPERDIHNTIETIYKKTLVSLGQTENAKIFLDNIRKEKVRYYKDHPLLWRRGNN